MQIKWQCLLASIMVAISGFTQSPKPTKQQLIWHEDEYYWFLHFGPNTFTGKEWGDGKEKTEIFNPTELNTDQWCRIAKAAGASGMIITAKHHDGFCLWPSAYSTHTVRESKWKDGKGDVLADLKQSCEKYGLKFGVYISPWDRNHPKYGTPEYNDVYDQTLREIITRYGPIWEMWWDGANGEGPNGKIQEYDFPRFEKTVRSLSPNTVIFSDIGPDIRWIGNESGIAGETNWNRLDTAGFKRGKGGPPTDTLNQGNVFGKHWIPGEADVSIRPGWFFRPSENDKVKSPEYLFELYMKSVGRGANLLLNIPPDNRGLIHERDSAAVMGFAALRSRLNNNLAKTAHVQLFHEDITLRVPTMVDGDPKTSIRIPEAGVIVNLYWDAPVEINTITLRENIAYGQACAAFEVELWDENGKVIHTLSGTTIGRKRILTFPIAKVNSLRLKIIQQYGATILSEIEASKLE
jgi:alpha-L-fucosidase